eukprot:3625860-Rhodomonas_salina.1
MRDILAELNPKSRSPPPTSCPPLTSQRPLSLLCVARCKGCCVCARYSVCGTDRRFAAEARALSDVQYSHCGCDYLPVFVLCDA